MKEKKRKEERYWPIGKITNLILTLISIAIIAGLGYLGYNNGALDNFNIFSNNIVQNNTVEKELKENTNTIASNGQLKVYYIDVGQADSILVIDNDKTMLIDAGTNKTGKIVVDFLKEKKITKIDYLIGTHPHEDHIGGLDDVINSFEIGKIYMPKVQTNTKTFESVLDAVANKGLSIYSPKSEDTFKLETANCTVLSSEQENTNLNNSSIVIRMTYGKDSFLFMGDSEKEVEGARKWPQTNILKVGHHGSETSTTTDFLTQVKPEIAIISVGKDNSYGHPTEVVLQRLKANNIEVHRTDEEGTILITSDENHYEITTEM